jgi:hypothetical protein
MVQLDAISPDNDAVAAEYKTLLANNMAHWKAVKDGLTGPGIGDLFEYGYPYGPGIIAPWQQHFADQSVGMGSDLEPLSDMTVYNEVRDYLYKWPVGILGDSNGFYFNYACTYNASIAVGTDATPTNFFPAWPQVWNATVEGGLVTNPIYDHVLKGGSGGQPSSASTGYWGNLMPAIAYAVDHGAPGAAAAWARLTGASNWPVVESSGFDDIPIWGIVPRPSGPSSAEKKILSNQQLELSVFPNPAATGVLIQRQSPGSCLIRIFDVRGAQVRMFVLDAGVQAVRWDGKDGTGNYLTAGLYTVRAIMPEKVLTKAVMLLK